MSTTLHGKADLCKLLQNVVLLVPPCVRFIVFMSWGIVSSCGIPILESCKIGRCLDEDHRYDVRSEQYSLIPDVSTKGLVLKS